MPILLPGRERQILDALFAMGEGTAEEIRAALGGAPSNSAVRALLSRLKAKGLVSHRLENQSYVYAPAMPREQARKTLMQQLTRTFFNDSPIRAATAFLGMSDSVDEGELRRLERTIRAMRKAGR